MDEGLIIRCSVEIKTKTLQISRQSEALKGYLTNEISFQYYRKCEEKTAKTRKFKKKINYSIIFFRVYYWKIKTITGTYLLNWVQININYYISKKN